MNGSQRGNQSRLGKKWSEIGGVWIKVNLSIETREDALAV